MRTKWIYTVFVLALCLFASCSNEADDMAGDKKTRTIVFRLSVDDAVGSRVAWSENDSQQHGTPMENRINLKGLRVVIYSIQTDGTVDTRVGEAANVSYWPINDATNSNDPIEYQLVGDISDLKLEVGTSYRFMVFANFPHTTNNQFDVEDVDVTNGYIPLWGVKTCTLEHTDLQELGTIDLLRAAAKVEVTFAEGVTNAYTVSALAIKNYSSTGNNLPTGWNRCTETKELDMDNCINVTGSHVHGTNLSFLANKENEKYYIYIPEYANLSHNADDQSVVVVELTKGTNKKTYEIPFCSYSAGAPVPGSVYNIVRNHIYQFNVTDVAAGSLLLNLKVADWVDGSSLTLGSLAYPTYGNPVLPTKTHTYPSEPIDTQPTMRYTSETDIDSFEMYFNFKDANVTGLSGYVWKPTIVDQSSTAYKIEAYRESSGNFDDKVYEATGSTTSLNELEPAYNKYTGWFKIIVTPTAQLGTGVTSKEYTFGIACGIHPSGFPSDDFFLFINGENDNIAWPMSGNDRKFIKITQVAN